MRTSKRTNIRSGHINLSLDVIRLSLDRLKWSSPFRRHFLFVFNTIWPQVWSYTIFSVRDLKKHITSAQIYCNKTHRRRHDRRSEKVARIHLHGAVVTSSLRARIQGMQVEIIWRLICEFYFWNIFYLLNFIYRKEIWLV